MYDHISKEMVNAGVAEELTHLFWCDRAGNETMVTKNIVGCKVTHKITRPDMILVGDEVDGNLCIKGDSHVGDKLLLIARGTVPKIDIFCQE